MGNNIDAKELAVYINAKLYSHGRVIALTVTTFTARNARKPLQES